jgi:hypothetical protein
MKKPTLIIILILLGISPLSAQNVYDDMVEESLLINTTIDQKQFAVTPCKALVTVGLASSKIRVKKSEIQGVIVDGNENGFYVRGNAKALNAPISLIRLTDKGKALQAASNSDFGKKFPVVPTTKKMVDKALQIYRISVLTPLENGYYAFVFNKANSKGNLSFSDHNITSKPMVFQVVNPK